MDFIKANTMNRGFLAVLIVAGFAWSSCSENTAGTSMTTVSEDANTATTEQADRVKKIFYSIPSPVEMVSLIRESGARYDHTVLNDVQNRSNYTNAKSKAMNLGIYGADLSYTSVFNQNQESIIYLSCAKQLADDLGVSGAFSDEMMERVEMNLEDRDSLMHIITETFYELDAYLKENDRSNISAQVITGGWLEGLYLASIMVEKSGTDGELTDRLVDQKYALEDLIALNEAYNQGGSLDNIISDLKHLKEVYDRSAPEEIDNTQSIVNGKVILGADEKMVMSPEDIQKVIMLAKDMRSRYIQA